MVVSALTRKLIRDLNQLRGQVVTIALVVACGVAAYIAAAGTWQSLAHARDDYYQKHRLADVFANVETAPEGIVPRIEQISGVRTAYSRIRGSVTIPQDGEKDSATGIVTSLPLEGEAPLNGIELRAGRLPDPGHPEEILVGEPFAKAHNMVPGDSLAVILNGQERTMKVVGFGLSPEYVFVISPTIMMPDDHRFGVFWMGRAALAAAFQKEGAFNELVVALQRDADESTVIDALDRILEPFGGQGAIPRSKQMSYAAVEQELGQLQGIGVAIPIVFLGVAAFLLNVVLSRLIELQRGQIAILKALGYSGFRVAVHYLELIAVVVIIGALVGIPVGIWVGRAWTGMYAPFFRFPDLQFKLEPRIAAIGVSVSVLVAVLAALRTVRSVAKLPPAEAMNPPSPATYGSSFLQKMGAFRVFGNASRMVLREVARRPFRSMVSSTGIAAAMGIVVLGSFQRDAVGSFMDTLFGTMMREDMSLALAKPVPLSLVANFKSLPGVREAEGMRAVPVRFRAGHKWRDGFLQGHVEGEHLRQLVEYPAKIVSLEADGIAVSAKLAEVLGLVAGNSIEVEVRERVHVKQTFVISRLVDDSGGLAGHLRIESLARMLGETPSVSSIWLSIDPKLDSSLRARIRKIPGVVGVGRRAEVVAAFNKQMAASMNLFTNIMTIFAIVIAVGIIYNNARIVLSTRNRELASLRVLGFTRAEVTSILLGELGIQVAIGIPLGILFGRLFAEAMLSTVDPEQYRFHLIIQVRTYASAVLVVIVAAIVSALLVKRRLDQLDLIGVLKTRE